MSLDPCYACENGLRPFDLEPCAYCSLIYGETGTHPNFRRKKPYTQYDRLKCFDAEALAEVIYNCAQADIFRLNVLGTKPHTKEEWLDWLQSPVQPGEGNDGKTN